MAPRKSTTTLPELAYPDDTISFEEYKTKTVLQRKALKLSPTLRERFYQRLNYEINRDERLAYKHDKWRNDPLYKKREIQRARQRRAFRRAETAGPRFQKMVAEAKKDVSPVRPAAEVEIAVSARTKIKLTVFTPTVLARAAGRKTSTVRAWLENGALPGCSAVIAGRAKFTQGFISAVQDACARIYYYDGRGDHTQLRLLIIEKLAERGESYVPVVKHIQNGKERPSLRESGARVWPRREGKLQ